MASATNIWSQGDDIEQMNIFNSHIGKSGWKQRRKKEESLKMTIYKPVHLDLSRRQLFQIFFPAVADSEAILHKIY